MKREDLVVGNKYKNEIIVTVNFIGESFVVFTADNGKDGCCSIGYFISTHTPYTEPQFEWRKTNEVRISFNVSKLEHFGRDYDYELLYNYKRYREECDTVKADYYIYKNHKSGYCAIEDNDEWENVLSPSFSTEEHAETFLKLAKENDCL